jgi:hypothetical protein
LGSNDVASNKIPNKKHMREGEKEEWEEWLEEQKGIMFKIEWFRIILDEAQYVSLFLLG